MLPYTLTNFEIQKYHQNEPKFNEVYSRNNLPKIKNEVFVINRDDYKSIGTYLTVLYINGTNVIYFEIFRVGHIPKEIKKFVGKKIS